jgi:hypothetical protein
LTAFERAESEGRAMLEKWLEDVRSGRTYERNRKLIEDLPPGTMVRWGAINYTREQLLELVF